MRPDPDRPVRAGTSRPAPPAGRARRRRSLLVAPAVLCAVLLAGCGGDDEPALTAPPAGGPSAQAAPAPADASPPVFTETKPWSDAKGNQFTILVSVARPSNAGLAMCSMGNGGFTGPSLVLSVRNDSKAKAKGPQISADDRAVAFPVDENGCSYIYAPAHLETFDPGASRTYRSMVIPWTGTFEDVVLRLTTRGKGGKLSTKALMRIPADKLFEAYNQGPIPGGAATPAPDHHGG